jgi:hypothetical protein
MLTVSCFCHSAFVGVTLSTADINIIPELSDSFKVVIARSGATWQSHTLKDRFFASLRMTILKGLYIKIAQFGSYMFYYKFYICIMKRFR